jgi:chloride channel protein, CIC family
MTTQSAEENLSQRATRPKMGWSILRMVVLSIIVGILAAGLAKLLLMAIGLTETYLHDGALFNVDGTPLMDLAKEQGIENATLRPFNVIVMVVFGLIVGCMTYYLMPNRANRGLSHVIEDVHFNKGATGVKEGLTVGAISAVSIGAGASVGRFGPAVHLGAAAASGLGAVLKLDDQERLTLSCAGMAAAISASFLSPLAAVIFVQEVVLRQWRLYQFIPIAAAAVAASETAALLDVHFIIPSEIIPDFVNPYEFIFFGIIGLLCGGLAIAFNRALPAAVALVGKHVKIDNRLKPALGGLVLAGIGFYFPSVLGLGGYETQLAVAGGIALKLCLILLALKFVATIASFAFGFNGGVFGPSLFMGAMLGLAVGLMVEGAGVEIASLSLYALAGMGAMVAGVVGAVMSAIIMMIEMTGRLTTSLPLLFSVTCVYVVIYLTGQSSLLVNQLKGRGKNPWEEIRASDKKYTGVKES